MTGVAGPMVRHRPASGIRFLAGLTVGAAAGGMALAVPAYLVGSLLNAALAERARLWAFVLLCVVLAAADLANRTPHVWRQVPQRLIDALPPGTVGLAWGFDLGLLFTTQKVTSLIWVAVAAVTLVQPAMVWAVLVGVAVLASLAVMVGSTRERTATWLIMKGRLRVPVFRRASAVAIAVLAITSAAQAWQG
jgi:hypothetical protein